MPITCSLNTIPKHLSSYAAQLVFYYTGYP